MRNWRALLRDRTVVSWSLYDWANSAFATTVLAGFFPVFFKGFWSAGHDVNTSTYNLGFANSLASCLLAFLTPIIGAIADQTSIKKKSLLIFTWLGITATSCLFMVDKGNWQLAVFVYVIANIGFAASNSFYDSLLVAVCKPKEMNQVSSLGFSLGYLGGGVLFAINVGMTLKPELFGLADAAEAVRYSFLTVAVWWFVFSLPLMFFVKEERRSGQGENYLALAFSGIKRVLLTLKELKGQRNLALFLCAYFFYIDGVNTFIRMAVDYGMSIGLKTQSLIAALLITQFVGFPAAIAYGHFADRIGTRLALFIAIGTYASVNCMAYGLETETHFYMLAAVIGLVQGGIQSLSRSVFGQMIPEKNAAEYFGFYNMLGKFSSMMGPLLVGGVSMATGDSRLAILSIVLLFVIGATLLSQVELPRTEPLRD